MKPIKLIMQAFGPFAGTETIAFEQLGNNPLFLINGPTGSGKTSILDAICFALYGETTSNERQGIQMRCDMANLSLTTEVVLEFALHSKRYRVVRSPEQEAPKARGEGTTTKKHTASLYEITNDASLITSKTAQVKTEVTKLIGLNETQFRQVMVLPQGKFRELLLASSKEREEIFGQLFQTDIYKKIEYALKDKANAISKAKHEFDNQIRGALQVAEVSSENELNEQLKHVTVAFEEKTQQEQQALDKLNQTKAELQSAQQLSAEFDKRVHAEYALAEHLKCESKMAERQQQVSLAQSANKLALPYANYQQAIKQQQELTQKVAQLAEQFTQAQQTEKAKQAQFEQAKQHAQAVAKLTEQQFTLESMKGKLIDKAKLEKAIAEGIAQQAEDEGTLKKFIAHKDKLTLDAEQGQQLLEQARVNLASMPSVEADIQAKTRLLNDIEKLAGVNQAHAKLIALTSDKRAALQQAQQALVQRQQAANLTELHWHNGQAALLAQRLEFGNPCPVCGSHEHPQPAQVVGDMVTKEQVQHARALEQEAQALVNEQSNQLAQHELLVNQHQQQIDQINAELGDNAGIELAELQAAIVKQNEHLHRLRAIDIGKLEQNLAELKQRCQVGEAKINELRNQMAANSSTLTANQNQLTILAASINQKYGTLAQLEQEISACQLQITTLNKGLETAQQALQQAQLSLSKMESEWQTHQMLLSQATEKQNQMTEQWQSAIAASDFADQGQFLQSQINEQTLVDWQQEIEVFNQTKIKLTQTLADLNNTLNAKEKPDLETVNQELATQQELYNGIKAQLDNTRSVLARLKKVSSDIHGLHQQNAKLEQEYKIYGTLYDVASGKTGSRISLHRFVLGVLLDDVLIQASQRLSVMSKGRYILARKTHGFKGVAGRGLDLVVEDGYTGKMRDVATLSGGESFMAALALALGLSDVVQSYSGGIRLDTLFIDEGFGSLDPESLDLAIQTLVDLQQTGRMIGVISHVSELKEQMAQRIDVNASRTGSTVSVTSPLGQHNHH